MSEIDHEYTAYAVCPYCGQQYLDCHEFEDSGDYNCESCGKEFHVERDTTITYSTTKNSDNERENERGEP